MEKDRGLLIKELAEYMYAGFSLIREYRTLDDIVKFFDKNLHRTVYIREGKRLVGVAVYMMITDKTLEDIVAKRIDLKDLDTFKEVELEEGNNMHVYAIRAERMTIILKGLKSIFKTMKSKTISWIKPNMKDITVIKRRN